MRLCMYCNGPVASGWCDNCKRSGSGVERETTEQQVAALRVEVAELRAEVAALKEAMAKPRLSEVRFGPSYMDPPPTRQGKLMGGVPVVKGEKKGRAKK